MRARRFLLLAGVAGSAILGAASAHAASSADMGSWGQAWGDEYVPEQAPERPRTAIPAAQPQVTSAPAVTVSPLPVAPSPTEIGGWGHAWGEDDVPAAAAPVARTAQAAPAPLAAPVPSQAPEPVLVQAQPPSPAPLPPTGVVSKPPPAPAPAEEAAEPGQSPVQLTADQIVHDRELGIVTARGRVEIVQEGRTLVADQVSYNLKQDIVSASGNVILTEPTGETAASDYFELTGDLKEGVAQEIRVLLADRSRLGAASARRVGGDRTDFDKAVYTACEPCREKPDQRPLWEVKAQRVTHNQADKIIEYRDAWLELGGVPVAYTPYLSHPDPTLKRKAGFLTPTAGMSSNIGPNVTVPYFWPIKDNQDVTFMPRFLFPNSAKKREEITSTDDDVLRSMVLAGEHRWRGREGEARTVASLTADKYSGDLRGHIDSRATFEIDRRWRAGYQLERASDDTYTQVYSYRIQNERPWLTTRPFIEGFDNANYIRAEGFAFQGLREIDDPGRSPVVLPHISTSHVTRADNKGGYWSFDNDVLAYARSEGTGATRLSSTAGWHRPFMGSLGDVTTLSTSLRADGFHGERVENYGSTNAGRVVPQVAVNWRMPFVRPSASMPQIIEPVAMVAASPNGGNSPKIPNEDSIGFELDEVNVLRPNRLPGLDRVEGGVRGAYGLRWQGSPANMGLLTAALAQGWRARDDSTFSEGSGFEGHLSDYLSRLQYMPSGNLSLVNRLRLDKETGEVRRNENTVSIGSPLLRTSLSYIMLEKRTVDDETFNRRHYAAAQVEAALTRYWSTLGGVSYDLTEEGGPLEWNARLTYNDECFAFITNLARNFTYDRDFEAGYTLTFNVVFKTLGDLPFNAF